MGVKQWINAFFHYLAILFYILIAANLVLGFFAIKNGVNTLPNFLIEREVAWTALTFASVPISLLMLGTFGKSKGKELLEKKTQ